MTSDLRLRQNLKLEQFEQQGQRYIALKCPYLLSEPLVLIEDVMPLLAYFDGNNSAESIKTKFKEIGLPEKIYPELHILLNNHLLLENETFFAKWDDFKANFITAEVRESFLAGRAYIDDATMLREEICNYLALGNRDFEQAEISNLELPLAIIAPHIDYGRGGKNYGISYNRLVDVKVSEPPVAFIFGICHQPHSLLFQFTKKHFQTPLGLVKTESDLIDQLSKSFKDSSIPFVEEMVHIFEHSIELQLPFLQTIWGDNFSIVPILFGSFHSFLCDEGTEAENSDLEAFLAGFSNLISTLNRPWTVILSVDMSHMGRAFGDPVIIDKVKATEINIFDAQYIDSLVSSNKLLKLLSETSNQSKICGYPAFYCFLRVMEKLKCEFKMNNFNYNYSLSQDGSTFVSFQSGSYERV